MLHEPSALRGAILRATRAHMCASQLLRHRMRCILTVNFSPWSRYSGGGQRSTHNLARALVKRGHEVTVVFTKAPWEQVPLPPDLPYQVVWAALPGVRRTSSLFVARAVQGLLMSS